MDKLTIIGNPNTLQNQALNAAGNAIAPDSKVYDVGGFKFTGKAAKEVASKAAGTVSASAASGATTGQVVESALRTGINAVAPGLGNVLPVDRMLGLYEVMLGQDMNKPINKYTLGDVLSSVGQILVSSFNPRTYQALLKVVGIGPPTDLGKYSNYIDPREGPKVYAPTDLFKPITGSPNNYPIWYSGGNVVPLHSPFIALNSLNASLSNDQWSWVIGQSAFSTFDELKAAYNAGKLYKTAAEAGVRRVPGMDIDGPIQSNIWFEFWCIRKDSGDWNLRKQYTDTWLVNLWQLNGQPNPILAPQDKVYTFAPDTDPGDFWTQIVKVKNPTYYSNWVRELASKIGVNMADTMRKYGIDPMTGAIVPPAPPVPNAPAPRPVTAPGPQIRTQPKPAEAGSSLLPIVGAGALLYFLTKK